MLGKVRPRDWKEGHVLTMAMSLTCRTTLGRPISVTLSCWKLSPVVVTIHGEGVVSKACGELAYLGIDKRYAM